MKKQLAGVQFTNLLQINWNEQKIQNNFKIIADALLDHDKDKNEFKDDIESLKEEIVFIKALIKQGGTTITNHNVNVTRQESKGDKEQGGDPFKIREMLQKLQKEIKQLNTKQNETDMVLDKVQDVQEKLKEDVQQLHIKAEEKSQVSPIISTKGETKPKGEQNIRRHSAVTKKNKENEKEKEKSQTSIKDNNNVNNFVSNNANNNLSNNTNNSNNEIRNVQNNEHIAEIMRSNKNMSNQLLDLLDKIDELKSDNIKITARLNAQEQSLQNIRKAPALTPSRLRTTETKPSIDLSKIQPQKPTFNPASNPSNPTSNPTSNQSGNSSDSDKNIKVQGQIEDLKDDLATLENEINKYYLDANTLRLCYQEMKIWINDLKKADSKKDTLINEINNKIAQTVENQKSDKERIDQELKQIRATLLKAALEEKKAETKPDTPSVISSVDRKAMQQFDENYKDKINDKLSKLQTLLMQAATQSDLERVRVQLKEKIQDTNSRVEGLKVSLADVNKKLEENELDQQSQNSQIRKLESDLAGLSGLVNDKFGALEKKGNITNSKIEEMKKSIQHVKEDLEFYKQSFNKPSSNISGNGGGVKDENGLASYQGRNSIDFDKRKYEELKKQIFNKIHDNKTELYNALKDFQRKTNNKNTFEQDIAILFDKIGEIKLFLGKKADAEDTKKSILYLEKKMSVALANMANEDDVTQDARAAKKNWFCLSCDKVLQNYNGKVGKHIVWDGLGTTKFATKTSGDSENKRPKELQPIKK